MTAHREQAAGFTVAQRVMLQHANPVKLVVDLCGAGLGLRLAWARRLGPALLCTIGSSLLGSFLVRGDDPAVLARSRLGQWMLPQADPANLVIRGIGFAVVFSASWRHSVPAAAGGSLLIAAGRVVAGVRSREQRPVP